MTFSIVARDPETGALGVGVATHQPCVGAIVPWVRADVGAVATQSFVNPAFGPEGLALLESGLAADHALTAILAGDDQRALRQVAIIDAEGRVAAHTGGRCIPFAGHVTGENYSVQANMMLRDTVPGAMARAFEAAAGRLAERILVAMEAAQAEGGDIRGRQSAAILVRRTNAADDYRWNLRVDDDPEPLARLRELVHIRAAGEALREAEAVQGETAARLEALEAAFARAHDLAPSDEQTFWFAVTSLAPLGALDRAEELLRPLFARAPQWRELLNRLDLPGATTLRERPR